MGVANDQRDTPDALRHQPLEELPLHDDVAAQARVQPQHRAHPARIPWAIARAMALYTPCWNIAGLQVPRQAVGHATTAFAAVRPSAPRAG